MEGGCEYNPQIYHQYMNTLVQNGNMILGTAGLDYLTQKNSVLPFNDNSEA